MQPVSEREGLNGSSIFKGWDRIFSIRIRQALFLLFAIYPLQMILKTTVYQGHLLKKCLLTLYPKQVSSSVGVIEVNSFVQTEWVKKMCFMFLLISQLIPNVEK